MTENLYFSEFIAEKNLLVISLNSNADNSMDWLMLNNPTDPKGMLAWLVDTLREAETNRQEVIIIGHICF